MTNDSDMALIATQVADLTHVVEDITKQLQRVLAEAAGQRRRADVQQERIDLAARELTEVSDRLHAAATALRQSV